MYLNKQGISTQTLTKKSKQTNCKFFFLTTRRYDPKRIQPNKQRPASRKKGTYFDNYIPRKPVELNHSNNSEDFEENHGQTSNYSNSLKAKKKFDENCNIQVLKKNKNNNIMGPLKKEKPRGFLSSKPMDSIISIKKKMALQANLSSQKHNNIADQNSSTLSNTSNSISDRHPHQGTSKMQIHQRIKKGSFRGVTSNVNTGCEDAHDMVPTRERDKIIC